MGLNLKQKGLNSTPEEDSSALESITKGIKYYNWTLNNFDYTTKGFNSTRGGLDKAAGDSNPLKFTLKDNRRIKNLLIKIIEGLKYSYEKGKNYKKKRKILQRKTKHGVTY